MLSCGAAKDQLVVVARKTHRIGGQPAVSFADIVDEAFVGLSDAPLGVHLGEASIPSAPPPIGGCTAVGTLGVAAASSLRMGFFRADAARQFAGAAAYGLEFDARIRGTGLRSVCRI